METTPEGIGLREQYVQWLLLKVLLCLTFFLSSVVWAPSSTFAFHSEKPGTLSWSPDASIFAVAVGPHVAVYDPIASCLRQTLTSPECQAAEHAHFIGASGRHLVAAGAKIIILWDLIKSQGMFYHIQDFRPG